MLDFIVLFLTVGIPLSSALLLAALGETVNQRSGVFNLGCEGVMSMGAFVGMLIPFMAGGSAQVAWYVNLAGLVAAAVVGALFGGLHPLGVIPAAFFFAVISYGCSALQINKIPVPSNMIDVLQGLVILVIVAAKLIIANPYLMDRAQRRVSKLLAGKEGA